MVRKKKAAKVLSSLSKQKPRPEAEMFSCSETEKSCNGSPDNQESSFSKHEASGSSIKRKERKWDTEPEDPDALQANNEVVKKRKTRWSSDDAQLKRLGPLQLPDFQGIGETQSDFEVQELNNQLMEINKKLLELVENGNSFDPVSTKSGLSCANEIRQELINRKQQIVSKLVEKTLGLKSLPDNKPAILYKKLYIPVKQYPDYNFVGLILGPRGSTLKRMETETGAKILLRGKGSIREDKPVNSKIKTDPSANEDLHVRIEANNQESMDAAVEMVEKLLVPVEDNANDLKREQLFDLAVLNGKVARSCTICGDIGHFTRLCPLIASHPKIGQHDDPLTGLGASAFSSITGVSVPSNVSSGRGSSAGTSNAKGLDKTNLYVGYLPDFINEVSLKQLFDPFGTIASLRVARDPATGVSKGHGFVKYCDPASAAIAIEKMHKFVIGNKTLAVRVAGPPPTTEGSASPAPTYPGSPANPQSMSTPAVCPSLPQYGAYFTPTFPSVPGLSPAGLAPLLSQAAHPLAPGHLPSDTGMPGPSNVSPSLGASTDYSKAKGMDDTNLYVEHLPDSVDEVRLKQLFDPFGTITGVRVARDPTTNARKGYGFVRYRDPASAALAIEKMHNFMTENKVLAVRIAGRPRNPPGSSALMASTYTGLISNPQATSAQTVWPGFTPMVPGSSIPAAPAPPMSLGVHHSVPGCSPSDNGVLVPSNVNPILGNSAAKGVDEANLFVGQLPEYINEVSLKQLFDTFGTVTGVKVGRDPDTGLSKGFGFVRYSDPASAAIAIEKMNRFQIGNKFLVVGIAGRPPTTPATPAPPKPTYPSSTAIPHATLTPTVSPALVQQSRYFTQANPAAFSPPMSLGFHSSVPGLPLPEQPLSSVADYPTFPGWTSLTTPSQPFLDSLGTGHSRYPGFSASTAIAHPMATNPAVPGCSPFAPMQPVPLHFESSSAFVNFARHTGDASEASSMFPSAIVSSSTSSGVNFPGSLDHLPPASASLFSSQANSHTTHSSGTQCFPGNPDFFRSKLV